MACGTSVPQPGIEPMPPALEGWALTPWTTEEVSSQYFWKGHLSHLSCGTFVTN